jgi:hypothetical protein
MNESEAYWYVCEVCGARARQVWFVKNLDHIRLCSPPPSACIICGGDMRHASEKEEGGV